MDLPVQNITDLQSEILRLEALRQEQKIELKKRFSSPSAIFATVKTLFPRNHEHTNKNNLFSQDILGLLSRVVLPFTLNKTLFKNSNFLVKTLIGVVSQKASTYINEDTVTGVWGKFKHVFSKKPKKVAEPIVPVNTPVTAVPAVVETHPIPDVPVPTTEYTPLQNPNRPL